MRSFPYIYPNNLKSWLPLQLLVVFCISLCCASCLQEDERRAREDWMQPNGHLKVLSTTGMVGDIVSEIGGKHVDTWVLIDRELDPHSYQLVKGDDEKLSYADLVFYNGLGLEHGPSLHYYLTHSSKAISVGDYIAGVRPEEIIYVDGQQDPHIWMDISIFKQIIPLVIQKLSEKDPLHAEDFRLNGQQLYKKFEEKDRYVREKMGLVPEEKRFLVTSHDAFNYFTRAYLATPEEVHTGSWQNRFEAPEGLSPDSQIGTHEITMIIEYLKKFDIGVIFTEANLPKDSIKKIEDAGQSKGIHVRIAKKPLYGDAMGPHGSGADSYLGMIMYNADNLYEEWTQKE